MPKKKIQLNHNNDYMPHIDSIHYSGYQFSLFVQANCTWYHMIFIHLIHIKNNWIQMLETKYLEAKFVTHI